MQSADWVTLMGRIPADQRDNLILVTSTGIELAIQTVVRTEDQFLVVRGRMAGTDTSRILFIPYANIAYLAFPKSVKEAQIRAMFGELEPESGAPELQAEAPAPEAAPDAAAPQTGAAATNPTPPTPPPPTKAPDKRTMLERLRSRSFSKIPR
jgi:hypothetical protein